MQVTWNKNKPIIPQPETGRYGIEDEEDLAAWVKVARKFQDIGFILVCQLGIGQFGRVYEAINMTNPRWPSRVALVDLLFRARTNEYGWDPELFEQDIDRLIYLKRLFFEREIVLSVPYGRHHPPLPTQ